MYKTLSSWIFYFNVKYCVLQYENDSCMNSLSGSLSFLFLQWHYVPVQSPITSVYKPDKWM